MQARYGRETPLQPMLAAQALAQPHDLIDRRIVRLEREEDPMFRRSGSLPFEWFTLIARPSEMASPIR